MEFLIGGFIYKVGSSGLNVVKFVTMKIFMFHIFAYILEWDFFWFFSNIEVLPSSLPSAFWNICVCGKICLCHLVLSVQSMQKLPLT